MLVRRAALQEMPVAGFCHPSRAGEMALPGPFCPVRFPRGIDVQHDFRHFPPVRACLVGVEQTQIGDKVLLVISRQNVVGGCEV